MATKGDSSPGLLSKMVKFVRNPTRDWSELDQTEEPVADSGFSKEALRQMIERKRQNDFVRKREFDYLRKLRRRETLNGPDHAGRPSFFQSSLPTNPDERAMTLKKIDEIEAQMSRQWWQGKQDDNAARAAGFPVASKPPLGPDVGPTRPMGLPGDEGDSKFASTQSSALRTGSNWFEVPEEYALTRMDPDTAVPLQPSINRLVPIDSRAAPLGTGFAQSRSTADLADSLTDADLEEAAIRYANGDAAGAEAGLLAALQGDNLRPEVADAWMSALFDLYRATGQQARFDSVALDCAKRFGRSPPAWFSIPEQLARAAPAVPPSAPSTASQTPAWTCPAELTSAALVSLRAATPVGAGPRLLDWQALNRISPQAVEDLGRLVTDWCDTPVHLVLRGQAQLERALKTLTPSGDRSVAPLAWQLRMDVLRMLGLPDEFELVALDYCVTYEVSPPSWQEVRCRCEPEGRAAPRAPTPMVEVTASAAGAAGGVELAGEITGDASEALAQLDAGMEGSSRLVVSCARLIRVDFPAAGSILNWVAAQEVQGRQVQFRDVNRIVAAFFRVIGINEHARIVSRST